MELHLQARFDNLMADALGMLRVNILLVNIDCSHGVNYMQEI